MIAFILKVSLCWLFFYGLYELLLKKRTFFIANRSYLLSTLIIGILLPLLEFVPWKTESNMAYVIYPILTEIDDLQNIVVAHAQESFDWLRILFFVYLLGVVLTSFRFFLGLRKIFSIYSNAIKSKKYNYTLVVSDEPHLPFSFLNCVFLSNQSLLTNDLDQIIEHEIQHIKGKHSLDVLLAELLRIVFWCSPMIYLYKDAIKEVHEFLADHTVIRKTDKLSYKKLLLKQTTDSLQMALTHQFFNSHLKNRLKMINQKRSGRPTLVMYALGIPVLMVLVFAFTATFEQNVKIQDPNQPLPELVENIADYYMEKDPEKVPYFQIRGEDIELPLFKHLSLYEGFGTVTVLLPEDAVKKFGAQAKLGYINFENPPLKYESGNWEKTSIDWDTYRELTMESMRRSYDLESKTSKQTNSSEESEERKVRSAMDGIRESLLSGIREDIPVRKNYPQKRFTEIETKVDQIARFPGCEDVNLSMELLQKCSWEKMFDFLELHLETPRQAQKQNIRGSATVSFVVTKEGRIENIQLLRDPGGDCGYAAMEVIEQMSKMKEKWIPALKNGLAVNSNYQIPVRFGNPRGKTKISPPNTKAEEDQLRKMLYSEKTFSATNLKISQSKEGFKVIGDGFQFAGDYDQENSKPLVYIDGERWKKDLLDVDLEQMQTISYKLLDDPDSQENISFVWVIKFKSKTK